MAVSVFKTFSAGEVLTAADLNSSFTQITNNGTDVAFPLTKNGAAGGFILTGLGAGSADGDSVRFQQLPFSVNDFRLTLTSGAPVTTGDVTGATTIYASPKTGNAIGLYDGTNWHVRTSAEFSLALGTLTSGKPYDVFCYDNGGVPALELLVWTSDTVRATALTTQNGVYVKTGALTRRYLGTFYTTSTTATEDSYANRYLWNYYNRAVRPMRKAINSTAYTYTTGTYRQANNSTTNQVNAMIGVSEDPVSAEVWADVANTNVGVLLSVAIGVDSTTTASADCIAPFNSTLVANQRQPVLTSYLGFPGGGRHSLVWLESSTATGTSTWNSNSTNAIVGRVFA